MPRIDWLQAFGNLVLIFGLMMVVYELRQSRDFAEAQILTDEFTRMHDRLLAKMGDEPMRALAKSIRDPDQLTDEEIVTLDAYYNTITINWISVTLTRRMTGVEASIGVDEAIRGQAINTFTSEPGRRWIAKWAELAYMPEIADMVIQAVEQHESSIFEERYDAIKGESGTLPE